MPLNTPPFYKISIHALREEGNVFGIFCKHVRVISIHALREEGDSCRSGWCDSCRISIHALREEGDAPTTAGRSTDGDFYPRPPRGGRHVCGAQILGHVQFLSTPSARRAT